MNRYLLAFFVFPLFAHDSLVFNADLVDYDGQTLHLKENVTVQTAIGPFSAQAVDWEEQSGRLSLAGSVHWLMKDGAALSCDQAECDVVTKQIHLAGHVKLQYQNEMTVCADRAHYQRDGGRLLLQGNCLYSTPQGDIIAATEASLDFVNKQTAILAPKGEISLYQEKVHFSAGRLFWDRSGKTILLQEMVQAEVAEVGKFSVDEELALTYRMEEGKRELKTVDCLGKTRLVVEDLKRQIACAFACFGKVCLDREGQNITMVSNPNSQISFQDGLAKIAANQAHLYFTDNALDKVLLTGRVQMINRLTQFFDGNNPLQYALADTIEYFPRQKELNLFAAADRRVLFQDSVNHIQISAPGLKIKRTTPAQKGYIQGVGDVRFSFVKTEAEMLQNAFMKEGV